MTATAYSTAGYMEHAHYLHMCMGVCVHEEMSQLCVSGSFLSISEVMSQRIHPAVCKEKSFELPVYHFSVGYCSVEKSLCLKSKTKQKKSKSLVHISRTKLK